jgi:hypothetical protein
VWSRAAASASGAAAALCVLRLVRRRQHRNRLAVGAAQAAAACDARHLPKLFSRRPQRHAGRDRQPPTTLSAHPRARSSGRTPPGPKDRATGVELPLAPWNANAGRRTIRGEREAGVPRTLRQLHNRELFRAANDQIADLVSQYPILDGGTEMFICECSQLGCTAQIAVPLEVYARVRQTDSAYLVLAGHEDAASEKTIFGHAGYLIVTATPDSAST